MGMYRNSDTTRSGSRVRHWEQNSDSGSSRASYKSRDKCREKSMYRKEKEWKNG